MKRGGVFLEIGPGGGVQRDAVRDPQVVVRRQRGVEPGDRLRVNVVDAIEIADVGEGEDERAVLGTLDRGAPGDLWKRAVGSQPQSVVFGADLQYLAQAGSGRHGPEG